MGTNNFFDTDSASELTERALNGEGTWISDDRCIMPTDAVGSAVGSMNDDGELTWSIAEN